MLMCKEVTHLLSESQDRKLTISERLQLKMHLAMCSGCRNFKNQMVFLREACRRYVTDPASRKNVDR
jgi:hypothetical protein